MSHATLPAVVAPPRYGTARVGEKRELSSPTRNSCAEDTECHCKHDRVLGRGREPGVPSSPFNANPSTSTMAIPGYSFLRLEGNFQGQSQRCDSQRDIIGRPKRANTRMACMQAVSFPRNANTHSAGYGYTNNPRIKTCLLVERPPRKHDTFLLFVSTRAVELIIGRPKACLAPCRMLLQSLL